MKRLCREDVKCGAPGCNDTISKEFLPEHIRRKHPKLDPKTVTWKPVSAKGTSSVTKWFKTAPETSHDSARIDTINSSTCVSQDDAKSDDVQTDNIVLHSETEVFSENSDLDSKVESV